MAHLVAGFMAFLSVLCVWMGFFPDATDEERRRWWIAAAIVGGMPFAYAFKVMFLS